MVPALIPVKRQPEPSAFDRLVRQPGLAFLRGHPAPTGRLWDHHRYWSRVSHHLHTSYVGVCAYSASWLPRSGDSTDHFLPKSVHPDLAFEWSNYRLCAQIVNQYKGDTMGIIDPFEMVRDTFVLDFPSLLVKPARALPPERLAQAKLTIDVLRLNQSDIIVNYRYAHVQQYCESDGDYAYLAVTAPFIAYELSRQDIAEVDVLKAIMSLT